MRFLTVIDFLWSWWLKTINLSITTKKGCSAIGISQNIHVCLHLCLKVIMYTRHHLNRVIIGSAVLTKALPADCLRFQRVDPHSIYNINIFFCKMSTFLVVFLPNCCWNVIFSPNHLIIQQETPQCDENQVFNDSTKYWNDRNKKWKMAVKKKWCPYFGCTGCMHQVWCQ